MTPAFRPSAALEVLARNWLRDSGARDYRGVTELLSASPALTFVGSADNEIMTDETLRSTFANLPDDLPPFEYQNAEVSAYERGPVGWVVWTATMFTPQTGVRLRFRGTLIFDLQDGEWKIVHIHNSNPVSNVLSMGFDPGKFDELLREVRAVAPEIARSGRTAVMFTDIAESSTIAQTIGDTAWSRAIILHIERIGELISESGGVLVKSLGDGTMSTFPTAHAAVSAARSIQTAIASSRENPRFRVRIGIHTGAVVESGDDFFGTVVNKAARIADTAGPGEIRVSDTTWHIVRWDGEFSFSDEISMSLRGLAGEHMTHRLDWQT